MARTFARLVKQLHELGLSMSVWSGDGEPLEEFHAGSEFCRMVSEAGGPCLAAHKAIAQRVVADGWAVTSASEHGCCLLGVPIYQRRRLRGALVCSFPAGDMLNEQALVKIAQELDLDPQRVKRLAADASHTGVEAQDFLAIVTWLLESNQTVETSDEEIANLTANLARTYEELSLVYRISGSMQLTQQPREFLHNICQEVLGVMDIDCALAVVRLHAALMEDEELIVLAGECPCGVEELHKFAVEAIAPRFDNNPGPILENHVAAQQGASVSADGIRNYVAVQLASDQPIGTLIGFNKATGDFDSFDLKLISSVGNQAGVFLANSRLYADLQDLLMGVLHTLTSAIDAKDPYTAGHSRRVALISKRLAEKCGYPPEKVQQVYLAGLLHDIGKIGVPEATLSKEGKLTPQEYEQIKRHPGIGASILGGIRQMDKVILYILTHHERPDGRGYPRGLRGDQIPIEGLIVGLADAFDAMTTERTYRKALTTEAAAQEIRRFSGKQFDSGLVDKLLAMDLRALLAEIHDPNGHGGMVDPPWQPLPKMLHV